VEENHSGLIILCVRRYMAYQKAVMLCDQKTQLYFMQLISRTLFFLHLWSKLCTKSSYIFM